MPRVVDHAERRDSLARAVLRTIGREGLRGASVREVAREAGVSMGGLRHYFADRRSLLEFAAAALNADVTARMSRHFPLGLTGPELARALLGELLPLDEVRLAEARVRLACRSAAPFDEGLAGLGEASWRGERYVCRIAVAALRELDLDLSPEARLDAEGEADAAQLHFLLDGLALQALTSGPQVDADAVRAGLERALEALG